MDILLVDDDQHLTMLLKMKFEDKGDHLEVAYNGYDGADLALKEAFDAIILDLMLPGMNGRSVCSQLREKGIKVPILLISSLDSRQEKQASIHAGANDYLAKPVPFEYLYETIVSLVLKHQNHPPDDAMNN